VCVLLCTLYTTCFGPDQWPSSGDLQYKIYLKAVSNISTDPLSQIYKKAKALFTVTTAFCPFVYLLYICRVRRRSVI
jgi:hypothetical protein